MEIIDLYDRNGVGTGRRMARSRKTPPGCYKLMVHIWPQNSAGEFLVQQRSEKTMFLPGYWGVTGGGAKAGETSIDAAQREFFEELGVMLPKENFNKLFSSIYKDCICDIYHVSTDIPVSELKFQPDEVADAEYMSAEKIKQLTEEGKFLRYSYFSRLTKQCGRE